MRARTLLLVLLLSGCNGKDEVRFADLSVTLPADEGRFPDGPGVDAVVANCGACHSPSMILTQPRLSADQWKSTIGKMREIYKAEIDPAAEPEILAYLETTSAKLR